jgi:hypothetical protein
MTRLRALASAALLLGACGHLDEIDVSRSGSATVPGGPGGAALPAGAIASFPVSIGRDALAEQGIDPNDVDSARLVGLRLEVTAGTPLPAWLDHVAIYVEAPDLPRVLVAEKSGIGALPPGTTAVDLDASGTDLKPYALAPTTTVVAEGGGTQPPVDTTVKATMTLRVDVNVSGLLD